MHRIHIQVTPSKLEKLKQLRKQSQINIQLKKNIQTCQQHDDLGYSEILLMFSPEKVEYCKKLKIFVPQTIIKNKNDTKITFFLK